MEMDKRTLIAIVLSLLILIASQYFLPGPAPQPEKQIETPVKQEKPETIGEKKAPAPEAAPAQSMVGSTDVRDVKIETEFYTAVLTSKGGTIKRFDLKKYKDKDGIGIPMLHPQTAQQPLSLGISTDDFTLSNVNYKTKGTELNLKDSQTESITFEYAAPQYTIKRTYTFYANKYKIDLKDEVAGLAEYWIALGPDFGVYDTKDDAPHIGPVILKDTDRIELTAKKLDEPKTYKEGVRWIAQEDKYFFASLIPSGQTLEARAWKVKDSALLAFKAKSGVNNFMIYAGPKEYERLEELNVGLEHVIDFGFFSILARPIFWALKFFYKYIGNYGLAIILITIITRVPFVPIIAKGQKSMKKMQELQPKMNELREKYKKDPQKLQKEMMEMYKKYKVNPMGGCLPMLLQIPVFFALYKVLMIAVELKGAPFMLWITDLSAKDPYYIFPIVMGATMVIQQKMTPTSLDPKQNKIMMLMPVIFTFMFLNFASGLVLYWLVNNILSIVQQIYINKKSS